MENSPASWFDLSLDAARLTLESGRVIGLRLALVARGGPDACAEAALMLSEKAEAAADAQILVADSLFNGEGHLALSRAVALYRDRVQANQRRLEPSPPDWDHPGGSGWL
jgi:hypothetical protein